MKIVAQSLFMMLFFAFSAAAQTPSEKPDFNFGFERISDKTKLPDQWAQLGSGYSLKIDTSEKKSGEASILIEAPTEKQAGSLGVVACTIPAGYEGKEIE